ncbi:MAG: S41 family peptidase, partial [Isosphaerales bacterium]
MQDDTNSRFGGLGVVVSQRDGAIIIVTPMEDSPGFKAGLLPNDQIIKIDGQSTEKMDQNDAINRLRGEPGQKVTLTILRPTTKEIKDFTITRENINDLIAEHGFEGPVDLLSIDIDGNDYWIWEAIEIIRPRVVIAEIQCIWGADRAVTVPYSPEFKTQFVDGFGVYCGASLPAFVKLAGRKGYRLAGVQRLGFNALFIQDGVGEDLLPEVDLGMCVNLPFVKWARNDLLKKVRDLPWVEV